MSFSFILKQLREEKQVSQKEIANYLGITRQAIASYELAKREPDYEILRKLADYFGVSVDYLLGRANCRDVNAVTVGKNIELIKMELSYRELSEDIGRKTGALIFPEMLELYCKGERMPFIGTLKILAKYAGVHESFFYDYNTYEKYQKEKELYKSEVEQVTCNENIVYISEDSNLLDYKLKFWLMDVNNIKYIKLAKEVQEAGLSVDDFIPLIDNLNKSSK